MTGILYIVCYTRVGRKSLDKIKKRGGKEKTKWKLKIGKTKGGQRKNIRREGGKKDTKGEGKKSKSLELVPDGAVAGHLTFTRWEQYVVVSLVIMQQ